MGSGGNKKGIPFISHVESRKKLNYPEPNHTSFSLSLKTHYTDPYFFK